MKNIRLRPFLNALAIAIALQPIARTQSELNHRIDLVLEQKKGDSTQAMDPTHVFSQGDLIRFRLRSGVNGFLYVLNQGSSGKFEQLFPRDELLQSRHIATNSDYLVPASGNGWFAIKDPPGFETVYFLISPLDLGKALPNAAAQLENAPVPQADPDTPAPGRPRCDDELFKARGECLDRDAGMKPIQKGEVLPERLRLIDPATSRDLVVVQEEKDTSVSSTKPFAGPTIYRFRIAHK